MNIRVTMLIIFFILIFVYAIESKVLDLYKVLGVGRNASQREIQKAFHKLSLQYHPDKNKTRSAREMFAEINNAYNILSNEEKRKTYNLYRNEKGDPESYGSNSGDHGGYTYFTSGGPGHTGFTFSPDEWQNMGGQGSSKSFLFSFGLEDIFSNFFGGERRGGSQFDGFSSSARSQSESRNPPKSILAINSQAYWKEISDKGITWLLLSYTSSLKETQYYESVIEEVASSLQGALKVGSVNCETDSSFCKELGIYPLRVPGIFVYSYKESESGSLVKYNGDLAMESLKTFCLDHLPRFSKCVDLGHVEISLGTPGILPKVILFSTKIDSSVIWRALSGLYHKRFLFYDAVVRDIYDPIARRLGVDVLPAVVGWLSNGEKQILSTGISMKDVKSAIHDISAVLNDFEQENQATASTWSEKTKTESREDKQLPLLTGSNFDAVCRERTPVCIIGAFRSSRGKENLEAILFSVSQKSPLRRRTAASSPRDSISYALLDATTQPSFLHSFDKSGFKSLDKLLVAYKPRKGKFAAFVSEITREEIQRFISSVLNGDVQFTKTLQKPTLK